MDCPRCGAPMKLWENRGYDWDNNPVHRWWCTKNDPATHWVSVWTPTKPWTIQLHLLGLTLPFLEKYHYLPADGDPLPEGFVLQARMFP